MSITIDNSYLQFDLANILDVNKEDIIPFFGYYEILPNIYEIPNIIDNTPISIVNSQNPLYSGLVNFDSSFVTITSTNSTWNNDLAPNINLGDFIKMFKCTNIVTTQPGNQAYNTSNYSQPPTVTRIQSIVIGSEIQWFVQLSLPYYGEVNNIVTVKKLDQSNIKPDNVSLSITEIPGVNIVNSNIYFSDGNGFAALVGNSTNWETFYNNIFQGDFIEISNTSNSSYINTWRVTDKVTINGQYAVEFNSTYYTDDSATVDNLDNVTNSLYYQGYYPIASGTISFVDDNGNVALTTVNNTSVSGLKTTGILQLITESKEVSVTPPINQNVNYYYWDEVFTTPIGLFQIQQAVLSTTTLNAASNNNTLQRIYNTTYGRSNVIAIKIDDFNIIPKVNDYFVIQKVFDLGNDVQPYYTKQSNTDSTTDDLNNLPLYSNSEMYTLQITGVVFNSSNTTGSSSVQGNVFILTFDKDIIIPGDDSATPDVEYNLILLNRYNPVASEDLLKETWRKTELHNTQLLGDTYFNRTTTFPQGRKNYLNYNNSGYLGIANLLQGVINSNIQVDYYGYFKSPVVILDLDNYIKDHINNNAEEVEIHVPGIMLQENKYQFVSPTESNYLIAPIIFKNDPTIYTQNGVGKYSTLSLNGNAVKVYGYVFYDLRIIVICDPETVMAMSYNSNRNFSLPALSFPLGINLNTNPDSTKNAPYTHFITYKFVGDTYIESLPYANITSFNWNNGLSIPTRSLTTTDSVADSNGFANSASDAVFTGGQVQIQLSDVLTYLKDNNVNTNLFGFEGEQIQVIIGQYDIWYSNTSTPQDFSYSIKGIKNIAVVTLDYALLTNQTAYNLKDVSGIQNKPHLPLTILYQYYQSAITATPYNLVNNLYSNITTQPTTFVTAMNPWLIGLVKHKELINSYRMQLEYKIAADTFNASTNPTFNPNDPLMANNFLISEIGFELGEYTDNNNEAQNDNSVYIYGKIQPPIKKNNSQDIIIRANIDF